jgi:hypothetical protein
VFVQRYAAGVNNDELPVSHFHIAFHAVTGYSGTVMGYGSVAADQPVEKGGFAHVGATDESYLG